MRHTPAFAVLCVALAGTLTAAHSDSVSYTSTYDVTAGGGTPVLIQQFNPALGTVFAAHFLMQDRGELYYEVDNEYYAGDYTVAFQSGNVVAYTDSQTFTLGIEDDIADTTFNTSGADYSGAGHFAYDWLTQATYDTTDAAFLAIFVGTGTINPTGWVTQAVNEVVTPDFGLLWQPLSRSYGQRYTVTYDYTPSGSPADVPEPTTFALLACGLAGLVGVGRKWRRG